jgi:hypothetical protein
MGAMSPRKREARKDETSEMREVAAYMSGSLRRRRIICVPVKRCRGVSQLLLSLSSRPACMAMFPGVD